MNPGDTVVQFDTTDQELKLKEAEADLAEAEQQVIKAGAESNALEEEAKSALAKAGADLRIAQLEARRNEFLPPIVAHQNDLAVQAAQEKLDKLQKDFADRLNTAKAGIAIQEAARTKAKVASGTASRNIASGVQRLSLEKH